MSGFIKLRRGLKRHWILEDAELARLFLYLLLEANWEDRPWVKNGETTILKRGELNTSERQIASHLNASRTTIKRRLAILEEHGVVSQRKAGKYTVISITKYDNGEDGEPEKSRLKAGECTREQTKSEPPKKNIKKYKKERSKGDSFQMPDHACGQFRAAFEIWEEHRKQLRKPLTKVSKDRLVAEYLDDPKRFHEAVLHSVKHGWQGLFEPKANGHHKTAKETRMERLKDEILEDMYGVN